MEQFFLIFIKNIYIVALFVIIIALSVIGAKQSMSEKSKKKTHNPHLFSKEKTDRTYYLDEEHMELMTLMNKLSDDKKLYFYDKCRNMIEENKRKAFLKAKENADKAMNK